MTQEDFKKTRIESLVKVDDTVYQVARVLPHAFALELVTVDDSGRKRKGPTVPAENCVLV